MGKRPIPIPAATAWAMNCISSTLKAPFTVILSSPWGPVSFQLVVPYCPRTARSNAASDLLRSVACRDEQGSSRPRTVQSWLSQPLSRRVVVQLLGCAQCHIEPLCDPFLPQPPISGGPGEFAGALAATGYMFPFIKGTEVLAGALLLLAVTFLWLSHCWLPCF